MTKWTQGAECAVEGKYLGRDKTRVYDAVIEQITPEGHATLKVTGTVTSMTGKVIEQVWQQTVSIEKLKPRLLTGDY